jgi:hypothetical protein
MSITRYDFFCYDDDGNELPIAASVDRNGNWIRWGDVVELRQRLANITKQLSAHEQAIGNLLARIHGDGGHYMQKHGIEKACLDGEQVVLDDRRALSDAYYALREVEKVFNVNSESHCGDPWREFKFWRETHAGTLTAAREYDR